MAGALPSMGREDIDKLRTGVLPKQSLTSAPRVDVGKPPALSLDPRDIGGYRGMTAPRPQVQHPYNLGGAIGAQSPKLSMDAFAGQIKQPKPASEPKAPTPPPTPLGGPPTPPPAAQQETTGPAPHQHREASMSWSQAPEPAYESPLRSVPTAADLWALSGGDTGNPISNMMLRSGLQGMAKDMWNRENTALEDEQAVGERKRRGALDESKLSLEMAQEDRRNAIADSEMALRNAQAEEYGYKNRIHQAALEGNLTDQMREAAGLKPERDRIAEIFENQMLRAELEADRIPEEGLRNEARARIRAQREAGPGGYVEAVQEDDETNVLEPAKTKFLGMFGTEAPAKYGKRTRFVPKSSQSALGDFRG